MGLGTFGIEDASIFATNGKCVSRTRNRVVKFQPQHYHLHDHCILKNTIHEDGKALLFSNLIFLQFLQYPWKQTSKKLQSFKDLNESTVSSTENWLLLINIRDCIIYNIITLKKKNQYSVYFLKLCLWFSSLFQHRFVSDEIFFFHPHFEAAGSWSMTWRLRIICKAFQYCFWQQESKFRTSQPRTKYRILSTGAHMLTKVADYWFNVFLLPHTTTKSRKALVFFHSSLKSQLQEIQY